MRDEDLRLSRNSGNDLGSNLRCCTLEPAQDLRAFWSHERPSTSYVASDKHKICSIFGILHKGVVVVGQLPLAFCQVAPRTQAARFKRDALKMDIG